MKKEVQQALWGVAAIVVILAAFSLGLAWMITQKGGVLLAGNTAGEVFNAHIQAMVDTDWELAHSYLHENCETSADELEDNFGRPGAVDPEEWEQFRIFSAGDDEALVWFPFPEGLQYMTKQDREWVINCENPQ